MAEGTDSVMLGLQLPTDPRWVGLVESNIPEVLTDHAWCEQKAASNAISTIVRYPELTDLVEELTRIAMEEMEHFGMVGEKIKARGWVLGKERKDPYIHDLAAFIKKEFDKKYNPTWHCIVGRNFGSYVTHEPKHFIYFYLGQVAILLFKSG